jgi:RNA polymerase sigma-70 factor (ECF subfamily)
LESIEILHIKQGQKKAFKDLYDQYFNTLCSFAYNYIPDIPTIEDFVQEAFISFWDKKSSFEDISAIKSYLFTAVRNKCLNHIKHQKVLQKNEELLTYEILSNSDSEQFIIEEETFRLLHNEIQGLPDSAKNIMILALNGLKDPEIAEELNISVNTVKTQKKIAYSKLKDKLKPSFFSILISL